MAKHRTIKSTKRKIKRKTRKVKTRKVRRRVKHRGTATKSAAARKRSRNASRAAKVRKRIAKMRAAGEAKWQGRKATYVWADLDVGEPMCVPKDQVRKVFDEAARRGTPFGIPSSFWDSPSCDPNDPVNVEHINSIKRMRANKL